MPHRGRRREESVRSARGSSCRGRRPTQLVLDRSSRWPRGAALRRAPRRLSAAGRAGADDRAGVDRGADARGRSCGRRRQSRPMVMCCRRRRPRTPRRPPRSRGRRGAFRSLSLFGRCLYSEGARMPRRSATRRMVTASAPSASRSSRAAPTTSRARGGSSVSALIAPRRGLAAPGSWLRNRPGCACAASAAAVARAGH